MASRADRPFRDEDRPAPREARPENSPPQNGWHPNEDDDRPREARRSFGPPQFDEGEPRQRPRATNGDHRPDPMQISNALTDSFATAVQRGAALLGNNMRAFQDETARFVSHRVERDMEAMEEFARARSFMELFSVQQRWLSNLTSDYSKGFARFSQLTGAAAEETTETGRRTADNARRAVDF